MPGHLPAGLRPDTGGLPVVIGPGRVLGLNFGLRQSGSPLLFFGGIAMIVLGVAGLGTVVYLQFIRPAMAAKKAGSRELFVSEDDDGYTVSQTPADPMSDTAEINLPDDGNDK